MRKDNLIIKDNYVYVSHYHDGLWIWDISDPSNPIVVGNYDTYPASVATGNYKGAWGVYPLLPSGNILVSDMQSGLFVFAPLIEETNNIVETPKPSRMCRMILSAPRDTLAPIEGMPRYAFDDG